METYDPSHVRDITDALIRAKEETLDSEKAAVGLTDEHIMTTMQELIGTLVLFKGYNNKDYNYYGLQRH